MVPKGTWFLYDSVGGTGSSVSFIPFQKQQAGVPCVIFSSPKDNNYKLGLKEMTGGIKFYLWTPAWELSEINGVMGALFEEWGGKNRTFDEFCQLIVSLFHLWGGIPRRYKEYAQEFRDFGKDIALQKSEKDFKDEMKWLAPEIVKNGHAMDKHMGDMDLPSRNVEQDGSSRKTNPPSWLVFPCPRKSKSGEDDFQERVFRFCSQRAELEFFRNLENADANAVRDFCTEVFRVRTANGIAFERFAYFVLTRTQENNFRWRKYAEEKKFAQLCLPKCGKLPKCAMKDSLAAFKNAVFNCIQNNKCQVIEPESDQQDAIDMFVVIKLQGEWHVLAMQDTISTTNSFHPAKILEYRGAARKALSEAKVVVKDDFFLHVVFVPDEGMNEKFSLLPAKHDKKSYWCPPEQTATFSASTSNAEEVPSDVIETFKKKYLELGLDPDTLNSWNLMKAQVACKAGKVKNYTKLKVDDLRSVGAGAKLLADAEEKVKSWTWVLDGFFPN